MVWGKTYLNLSALLMLKLGLIHYQYITFARNNELLSAIFFLHVQNFMPFRKMLLRHFWHVQST